MDILVYEWFFMEFRLNTFSLVLPGSYIHIVLVITFCLAFLGLALLTEMTATRLVTVKRIKSHKFSDIEEVLKTESLLKLLVELILCSCHADSLPEFLTESLDLLNSLFKTFCCTGHTDVLPHNVSEFLMDSINRLCTLDSEKFVNTCLNCFFSCLEFRSGSISLRLGKLM